MKLKVGRNPWYTLYLIPETKRECRLMSEVVHLNLRATSILLSGDMGPMRMAIPFEGEVIQQREEKRHLTRADVEEHRRSIKEPRKEGGKPKRKLTKGL